MDVESWRSMTCTREGRLLEYSIGVAWNRRTRSTGGIQIYGKEIIQKEVEKRQA